MFQLVLDLLFKPYNYAKRTMPILLIFLIFVWGFVIFYLWICDKKELVISELDDTKEY